MQEKRGILGGEKNNMVKSQPKKGEQLDINLYNLLFTEIKSEKIYIVMKAYWMYQAEIDRVFKNKLKAEKYVKFLNKKPNIHGFIIEKEIE